MVSIVPIHVCPTLSKILTSTAYPPCKGTFLSRFRQVPARRPLDVDRIDTIDTIDTGKMLRPPHRDGEESSLGAVYRTSPDGIDRRVSKRLVGMSAYCLLEIL